MMEFTTMVETRRGDVAMTFHVPEFREAEEIAANIDRGFKGFVDAQSYVRERMPQYSEQMIDDIAWALVERS